MADDTMPDDIDKAQVMILELEAALASAQAEIEHLKAIIAGLGGHVPDR